MWTPDFLLTPEERRYKDSMKTVRMDLKKGNVEEAFSNLKLFLAESDRPMTEDMLMGEIVEELSKIGKHELAVEGCFLIQDDSVRSLTILSPLEPDTIKLLNKEFDKKETS
tara:strand:- start:138 stop:470 length:333 start_codon:yes stop_codon:yes gene_type:complete